MPTPANGAAPELPVGDLTNVKIKKVGPDPTSSSNRLDASTLGLSPGSNRVYVDGLPDNGAGAVDGVTTTITCSFLTEVTPEAGVVYDIDGSDYRCTESEVEYAVGELVKGTATFVSVPPEGSGS
jgi:hypothetical protein